VDEGGGWLKVDIHDQACSQEENSADLNLLMETFLVAETGTGAKP
jgi:hypothetical protein